MIDEEFQKVIEKNLFEYQSLFPKMLAENLGFALKKYLKKDQTDIFLNDFKKYLERILNI